MDDDGQVLYKKCLVKQHFTLLNNKSPYMPACMGFFQPARATVSAYPYLLLIITLHIFWY